MNQSIADDIITLAFDASALLKRFFRTSLHITHKEDRSPVTEADTQANHLIVNGLRRITPDIPIISEESPNHGEAPRIFWLVDPLDGTRAFVRGEEQFSINIGLVENRAAVFGVLAVPMWDAVYIGGRDVPAQKILKDGSRHLIRARPAPKDGLHVIKSSSHTSPRMQSYLDGIAVQKIESYSSALKFALVAEGRADVYPRFGRTMEWDTASGQAIVEAAGGAMVAEDGAPFLYGKPGYENGGFMATGWKV